VTVDVANAQSTEAMAAQTVQRFGRIDILVNNAAVYGGLKLTPFEQIPEAEWDRVMAVNVKGIWLCCKAVIPTMKQQGKGKIINISSDTIWMGVLCSCTMWRRKVRSSRLPVRSHASCRALGFTSIPSPRATPEPRQRRDLQTQRRLPVSGNGS